MWQSIQTSGRTITPSGEVSISVREIAAREARNSFGRLLDAVQSAPVRVTRKGRAVAVMMSMLADPLEWNHTLLQGLGDIQPRNLQHAGGLKRRHFVTSTPCALRG